jgi:EAL domain-containing protein (putative c-di-GMP-specific phosphodiesterase class I)
LLKRADMAMYQAKAAGKNRVRFYDPQMQAAVNARVEIERGIRNGLAAGEFSLHYQTQFNNDLRVVGIEGLLRWSSSVFGNVPPLSFIPVAEDAGIIDDLGAFVLEQACLQLVEWSKQTKFFGVPLSINLSASQFGRPDFVRSVRNIIDKTGAPADLLVFELTETVLINDSIEAAKKMDELRAFGIRFALDDFGTGYSSLSYLRDLPLEQLKIDRSFVNRSPGSPKDVSVLKSIIALGKTLGMSVLAEGVETVEQRTLLQTLGCDGYQGYLFSYPVPADSL